MQIQNFFYIFLVKLLAKFSGFLYGREISEFNFIPKSVKIDKYQYYFSSRNEFTKTRRSFSKHLNSEFLFEVNSEMANKIYSLYGVPLNNGFRTAKFSAFLKISRSGDNF